MKKITSILLFSFLITLFTACSLLKFPAGKCQNGYHWNGTQCVRDASTVRQMGAECSKGRHWDGSGCVKD
ncbi:MAG: hypothetical protein ABIA04_01935 [Pseudomonadota bacterium]